MNSAKRPLSRKYASSPTPDTAAHFGPFFIMPWREAHENGSTRS
jgi:hypothetical protein